MIEGPLAARDLQHRCDRCGHTGAQSDCSAILAVCTECGHNCGRKREFCPTCGLDALVLACRAPVGLLGGRGGARVNAECGGPWRPLRPEAEAL